MNTILNSALVGGALGCAAGFLANGISFKLSYGGFFLVADAPVLAAGMGLALLIEPPRPDETPPTLLRNPAPLAAGEDLVGFYQMPAYHAWDPSRVLFFSFALFFAMILSDAGYAAVLGLLRRPGHDRLELVQAMLRGPHLRDGPGRHQVPQQVQGLVSIDRLVDLLEQRGDVADAGDPRLDHAVEIEGDGLAGDAAGEPACLQGCLVAVQQLEQARQVGRVPEAVYVALGEGNRATCEQTTEHSRTVNGQ